MIGMVMMRSKVAWVVLVVASMGAARASRISLEMSLVTFSVVRALAVAGAHQYSVEVICVTRSISRLKKQFLALRKRSEFQGLPNVTPVQEVALSPVHHRRLAQPVMVKAKYGCNKVSLPFSKPVHDATVRAKSLQIHVVIAEVRVAKKRQKRSQ
jgi:hypothetical protein